MSSGNGRGVGSEGVGVRGVATSSAAGGCWSSSSTTAGYSSSSITGACASSSITGEGPSASSRDGGPSSSSSSSRRLNYSWVMGAIVNSNPRSWYTHGRGF
jgi:hypothetical protein